MGLAGHSAPARWEGRTPARWTVVGSVPTTHLAPLPFRPCSPPAARPSFAVRLAACLRVPPPAAWPPPFRACLLLLCFPLAPSPSSPRLVASAAPFASGCSACCPCFLPSAVLWVLLRRPFAAAAGLGSSWSLGSRPLGSALPFWASSCLVVQACSNFWLVAAEFTEIRSSCRTRRASCARRCHFGLNY